MIESVVQYIEHILLPLGAWGVFLGSLIEQIIAPIPSSFVQLGAGFILIESTSFLDAFVEAFVTIAIPSAAAVTIGSTIIYFVAYALGKPFVERFGKYLGVRWEQVERLEAKFAHTKKDDIVLFLVRSFPAVPTVAVDVLCGTIRYRLAPYIILTFFGSLIRGQAFGLIGWYAGDVYVRYSEIISRVEKYIFVFVILIVFSIISIKIYRRKKKTV